MKGLGRKLRREHILGLQYYPPIMGNQMEKNMGHDMETVTLEVT